jgi:hypothetical protein
MLPRFEVVPLPDHQVSLRVDGAERARWHFGPNYPRPFFYPLLGPSGQPLTRMGHPGAPNHDHHQSIWFSHNKVLGIDFWGNEGTARIRQKQWLVYRDDMDAATMAVQLGWYDGHDPRELLEQELIVVVREAKPGETLMEIQTTFRPTAESLEFGKTNFGFLAVRVAKSLSAHFGGGTLTNSEGSVGEPAIFGKPAKWMDYSGPITVRGNGTANTVTEGITYFDHPANPRFPTPWHVRADGWMGAAVCLNEPLVTTKKQPLQLRYLLHAHGNGYDSDRAATIAREFHSRPRYVVSRSTKPHLMYEVPSFNRDP